MSSAVVQVAGERFYGRPMTDLDRNFVFATWVKSAREALKETKYVPFETFQSSYPTFVESLLDTERTIVFFREEEPRVIHAWACAGGPSTLHWAYVPYGLRGLGIGRSVITAALRGYPERIFLTTKPWRESRGRFEFNPFALRGPK